MSRILDERPRPDVVGLTTDTTGGKVPTRTRQKEIGYDVKKDERNLFCSRRTRLPEMPWRKKKKRILIEDGLKVS